MADNTKALNTSAKHSAASLSEEERTPKRLKSMQPDLVVVVKGVEFYHYKQILCLACPFFDDMLSANMRESHEGRVEFPDKNPDEWLEVYKFLDPTTTENEKKDMLKELATELSSKKALRLLPWFDYLRLDSLVKQFDSIVATEKNSTYETKKKYPGYSVWWKRKFLPCPLLQKVTKERFKDQIITIVRWLPCRVRQPVEYYTEDLKGYLLDDQCGDEMWQFLLSKVSLPESTLQEKSKEEIVNSSLFLDLLEVCGKDLEYPGPYKFPFPNELE